jgi:hypothetical protein
MEPMNKAPAKRKVNPPMAAAMMTFSRDQMEEPECSEGGDEWADMVRIRGRHPSTRQA